MVLTCLEIFPNPSARAWSYCTDPGHHLCRFVHSPAIYMQSKLTKCFSSSQRDYPKSLGECLQERGLSVEMLYLQAESGLTRALQDIRADGSPLCILVEHTNVALSSCTVIIFSESLKSKSLTPHRHQPLSLTPYKTNKMAVGRSLYLHHPAKG